MQSSLLIAFIAFPVSSNLLTFSAAANIASFDTWFAPNPALYSVPTKSCNFQKAESKFSLPLFLQNTSVANLASGRSTRNLYVPFSSISSARAIFTIKIFGLVSRSLSYVNNLSENLLIGARTSTSAALTTLSMSASSE